MKFQETKKYVYNKCVDRVNKKRQEQKKNMIDICPDDKSLVSHFFNCKCTKNNPYLVTKRLINFNDDEKGVTYGAIPILKFKDEFEVLWGDNEEFNDNLYSIFKYIIIDILNSRNNYSEYIENILCDQITFAKYSTFFHIKEKYNISLLKYFGLYEQSVSTEMMKVYLDGALKYLFKKPKFSCSFEKNFREFANKSTDYKFFFKNLENDYVYHQLIPLLKTYEPNFNSLGLQVKKLIEDNIFEMIYQIANLNTPNYETTPEYKFRKRIIYATSEYIVELEKIAEQYNTYF